MKDTIVIKLGGIFLKNDIFVNDFFQKLYKYNSLYHKNIVIVHGGGYWIQDILKNLSFNKNSAYFDNYKIDNNVNNYFKSGLILGIVNQHLLKYAQINQINSIGSNLTNGKLVTINVSNGMNYEYLFSLQFIENLFLNDVTPIISPIGIANNNMSVIIDSDIAAMLLAKALHAKLLIFTDVTGVLDGKGNIINTIDPIMAHQLISEGVINDGMVIKVNSAIHLAQHSKNSVNIMNCMNIADFKTIFDNPCCGTSITHK